MLLYDVNNSLVALVVCSRVTKDIVVAESRRFEGDALAFTLVVGW